VKIVDTLYDAQASIAKKGAAGFQEFLIKANDAKTIASESFYADTNTEMVTNLIQSLIIQNAEDIRTGR
jgi:hypothetical protein